MIRLPGRLQTRSRT